VCQVKFGQFHRLTEPTGLALNLARSRGRPNGIRPRRKSVLAEKRWRPSFAPTALVAFRSHLIQRLLNIERRGFLPLREVLEGLEELSHDGLRGNHDPELVAIPAGAHLVFPHRVTSPVSARDLAERPSTRRADAPRLEPIVS
jgi:hypothetical protein